MFVNRRYSGRVNRPISAYEKVVYSDDGKAIDIIDNHPKREDGTVIQLDVDQFSGLPFMRNANGFICNDIMVFEQCQSDSVARAVLQRLKVLHPENIDQKFSVDEMMSQVMPANYGSPSEYVSGQKHIATKLYKLYGDMQQAYAEKLNAQAAARAAAEAAALKKESSVKVEPEV